MDEATFALLQVVLNDMGYRTEQLSERDGLIAENSTRVVLVVAFDGVLHLLREWEDDQTWFVDTARERLTVDKSWELFLVLACRSEADPNEVRALQGIRRDASYARKLVISGLDSASPARLRDELAPLDVLPLPVASAPFDALERLRRAAEAEGQQDVLSVISAFTANRPLFEDLG